MSYDDSASNRLAAVRAAINACLNAQEYNAAGQMKQMARLRELRELEKDLQAEIAAASDGDSMCSLGYQSSPSL